MSELLFTRQGRGLLPITSEGEEWLKAQRLGAAILIEAKGVRNPKFHRKFFALMQLAYDYWKDEMGHGIEYKGIPVEPSFDRFRKDVTILAGFYRATYNIKGDVRLEAESIRFANMSEERFAQLYDAVITTLIQKIFNGERCKKLTKEELESAVENIMSFDSG